MKETYSRDELVGRPLTPVIYAMATKNLRGNFFLHLKCRDTLIKIH